MMNRDRLKDDAIAHLSDQLIALTASYYVIQGNGFIKLNGKDRQIREGTCIFVPAKADHKFHGNTQDLVIFYALGGRS